MFYVGDNSTEYLSFSIKDGLSISTDKFKLSAGSDSDYIYLSNLKTTIVHNSTTYQNILLKLGNNFGVANDGTVYATGAKVSGTITAGAGSKIGGWTINASTITGGNTTLNSNGAISSSYFSVSKDGYLSATSATFTDLSVTGDFEWNYPKSSTNSNHCYLYGETINIGVGSSSRIWLDGYVGINSVPDTTGTYRLKLDGKSYFSGNIYSNSNIYLLGDLYTYYSGSYTAGYSNDVEVDGWGLLSKATLVFRNGLLVEVKS